MASGGGQPQFLIMSRKFYFEFRKKFIELIEKHQPNGVVAVVNGKCYSYTEAKKEVLKKTKIGKEILCQFFGDFFFKKKETKQKK